MRFFHHSEAHNRKKEFQWGKRLGKGAYGEVTKCHWNAHDPPIDVAVKVVPKDKVSRSDEEQEKGMQMLMRITHSHIVHTFGWFVSRSSWYIIFELAAGGELYDRLEAAGKFTESQVCPMITDIMSALDYIHAGNVIHRDLKLENIFLRNSAGPPFDCLLADFGVSKSYAWDEAHDPEILSDVVGSPGYIAPEVVERKGYGKKVDVFALGVITFLLLFGRFPFKAAINKDFVNQTKSGVKFPGSVPVSPEARDFLRKTLAYNQHQRVSAKEALEHPWLTGKKLEDEQPVQPTVEPALESVPVEIPPPATQTSESSDSGEDAMDIVNSPKVLRVPTLATDAERKF